MVTLPHTCGRECRDRGRLTWPQGSRGEEPVTLSEGDHARRHVCSFHFWICHCSETVENAPLSSNEAVIGAAGRTVELWTMWPDYRSECHLNAHLYSLMCCAGQRVGGRCLHAAARVCVFQHFLFGGGSSAKCGLS